MSVDSNQRFTATYNRLDEVLRARLGADRQMSHAKLIERLAKQDPMVASLAGRLHAFRALRNAIVHMATDGTTDPIAVPLASVVTEYEAIVAHIETPPTALEVMATREVLTTTWDAPVGPLLQTLVANGWDTTPVIEDDGLSGLYTLRGLQAWVVAAGAASLDSTTFSDLATVIRFDPADPTNAGRTVLGVSLVAADTSVAAVEGVYRECALAGEFLSAVCITRTGRVGEPLLGLVTPANLPSANPEAFAQRLQAGIGH